MNILKKIKRMLLSMRKKQIIPIIKEIKSIDLLEGRCAIITGGSGDVGAAIAKSFVEKGATVYLIGRNPRKLEQISKKIGENCYTFQMDITEVNKIDEKFNELLEIANCKIDILVNSAGVLTKEKFGMVTENTWDSVLDTNLKGTFFFSQTVSNYWIDKKIKGNILNISSGSGLKPGWTPYQISKRALDSATEGMAHFLIKYGIVVNSISPGPVFSEMQESIGNTSIESSDNPTGRYIMPAEIGEWAAHIVSSMGNYAVGSNIHLTGGNGIFQFEDR